MTKFGLLTLEEPEAVELGTALGVDDDDEAEAVLVVVVVVEVGGIVFAGLTRLNLSPVEGDLGVFG